jgi:hypothetical protein
MHGMTSKMKKIKHELVTITPEVAADLLEHNTYNRPLSQNHVERIARQITEGKWKFNGDTIKVAVGGDVLDGQHRLWAVIEAKKPIDTIIVHGVEREAFATIDTVRRMRTGSDVLALNGVARYRSITSEALRWLIRWQRGIIPSYRDPANKIENSDIEKAFEDNPQMFRAVERIVTSIKPLRNNAIMAFMFYLISNRNEEIANTMIDVLADPSGVSLHHPFFKLRAYLVIDNIRKKDPMVTIALIIKAVNAHKSGQRLKQLSWKHQGSNVEEFPKLSV